MKLLRVVLVAAVLGFAAYVVIGGVLMSCSKSPTAATAVDSTPYSSAEGEQAYLTNMRNQGKAVSLPYCWWWLDRMDGKYKTDCRWSGSPLVAPQ